MKKPSTLPLKEQLFKKLCDYQLSDPIALAISGGPDSMAMACLLKEWSDTHGKKIHGLIVDHKIRKDSTREVEQVSSWLTGQGISNTVLIWQEGCNAKTDIQNKARDARYGLMFDWCKSHACDVLMCAHHLNDQLETFLMRTSKGTDLKGLCSMRDISMHDSVKLIRPFLNWSRETLQSFLTCECVHDPSNHNPKFERVRYRKAIRVLMDAGFDLEKFGLTLRKLSESDAFLEHETQKALARIITYTNDKGWVLSMPHIKELSFPIFKRVFEVLFNQSIRTRSLAHVFEHIHADDTFATTLGGYCIKWDTKLIYVTSELIQSIDATPIIN